MPSSSLSTTSFLPHLPLWGCFTRYVFWMYLNIIIFVCLNWNVILDQWSISKLFISVSFVGAPWRRLFPLHCLQWRKRLWGRFERCVTNWSAPHYPSLKSNDQDVRPHEVYMLNALSYPPPSPFIKYCLYSMLPAYCSYLLKSSFLSLAFRQTGYQCPGLFQ